MFEVLTVVIKEGSGIGIQKAVNFFWTSHCHTPEDSSFEGITILQNICNYLPIESA
jgi:hypothetical protein